VQGLIFVVDSNDKERIDEAREELSKMVSSQLKWHLVGVASIWGFQVFVHPISWRTWTDNLMFLNLIS